jgi:protein TIF31
MPECWLELLECEMVARSAKHVLDEYLIENGGTAASQPSTTLASFLSALMSTSEESAADTENRLTQQGPDSDDSTPLTLFNGGGENAPVRGHAQVQADITKEVGIRFRYSLRLYNNQDTNDASRTSLLPLLRRVCQRSGIRLYAKNYNIGAKSLCSMNSSYPIAVSDIAAVVPIMKHAASDGREGFVPCNNGAAAANASLHVLLPDAKHAYDTATMLCNEKRFTHAVDFSQEATNLYQRVTESHLHVKVSKYLDLTTLILFQAQEIDMSAAHAAKALAVAIQIGGFDSADVVSSPMTLSHILLNGGRLASSLKHMRAVLYLTELLAGPRHVELSPLYNKIGSIYSEVGNMLVAVRFFEVAITRKHNDRVFQGVLAKQLSTIYGRMGQVSTAFELGKQTHSIFAMTLGVDHEYTESSLESLKVCEKAVLEQNKMNEAQGKKLKEETEANAIGDEIVAKEIAEVNKLKKKKKKLRTCTQDSTRKEHVTRCDCIHYCIHFQCQTYQAQGKARLCVASHAVVSPYT